MNLELLSHLMTQNCTQSPYELRLYLVPYGGGHFLSVNSNVSSMHVIKGDLISIEVPFSQEQTALWDYLMFFVSRGYRGKNRWKRSRMVNTVERITEQ